MKNLLVVALLFLTLAAPAAAAPITVTAADRITVTFGTNPSNWDSGDPPDYFEFQLEVFAQDWIGDPQSVHVALYDGDRLLGSRMGAGVGARFQGAGMEVRADYQPAWNWPVMNFTSLLDGTINGRLKVSPVAGAFRFDPDSLDLRPWSPDYRGPHPVMLMDVLTNQPGWAARGDFDWIRDPQISVNPVPEPGTLTLLAAGLSAGALRWRKRRQRRAS